jgi:stage IV sporulation protein FB
MKTPEPQHTRFDLHGLLFGVPIRIQPLFWVSSALLGIRYYSDPEGGGVGYFAFWMLAALGSVLLHEYGHVLVGRFFGLRGGIVLGGLGGQTTGLDTLPRRWQRVIVLLAGPLVQLLILAGLWAITAVPFPEALGGWATAVATAVAMVGRLNAYWALLNLLPLWPLDGGRIACELGEGLLGRRGVAAALWLCLAATAALSVLLVLDLSWRLEFLRYDPRYVLNLQQFGVLLLFCFLLWIRSFRALWETSEKLWERRNGIEVGLLP